MPDVAVTRGIDGNSDGSMIGVKASGIHRDLLLVGGWPDYCPGMTSLSEIAATCPEITLRKSHFGQSKSSQIANYPLQMPGQRIRLRDSTTILDKRVLDRLYSLQYHTLKYYDYNT